MKKRKLLASAFALMLLLTACGTTPEPTVEETTPPPGGIDAPGFERTMINAGREAEGEKYVHGDEGYFLLAENGAETELKAQKGLRTSWVYAASTSMETNARLTRGEELSVDPYDILDYVYAEDAKRGIITETNNNTRFGGQGKYIAFTLSNGFGDRILTSARNCAGLSQDEIKQAIRTYGAMTTGITEAHNGRGFNDGYFTQYDEENQGDHLVSIVGWDDHFPKEIFSKTSFVETPSRDGAWIAQDSLMNTDYIYISYDTELKDTYIFELSDAYSGTASYDDGNEAVIRTGDTTVLANSFHQEGTLGAVGTYIPDDGEAVTIRIYDEKDGKLLHEQEEAPDIRGYYAFALTKEIPVKDYRIEITYAGEAPVEGADWEEDDLRYHAVIEPEQSYVKIGKKWVDLSDPSVKKKLKIDFEPHNACIKGLYK